MKRQTWIGLLNECLGIGRTGGEPAGLCKAMFECCVNLASRETSKKEAVERLTETATSAGVLAEKVHCGVTSKEGRTLHPDITWREVIAKIAEAPEP